MPYHLNLTLQQRATLSIATSIWNHKTVKEKITKWSDNRQILELGGRDEWCQLTKEVVEELNQDLFFPHLRGELIYIVKELGEKIFNWYIYIWSEYHNVYGKLGDITNYIDQIYWTSIGTIDEVKILQSYWIKNPDRDVVVVYKIACQNALEEDIDDLWQKMPCSIEDCYDKFYRHLNLNNSCKNSHYDNLILGYWKHRTNDSMDHFTNVILPDHLFKDEFGRDVFNQNYSVEHNMFLLSIFEGHSTAAKYFWNKLTQEERDSSVMKSAYITVDRSHYLKMANDLTVYKREKYFEILIFLINQMTISQKESLLRDTSVFNGGMIVDFNILTLNSEIISVVSSIWPWQELLIPVLNRMLQYPEYNKGPVLNALFAISKTIVKTSDATLKSKYRSIFHEVWCIIPGSMKRTMIPEDTDSDDYINFMSSLVKVGDLGTFNMIFNDPEIVDVKMRYIKLGRWGYASLIESNKYELLDQFMDKLLIKEYCKNNIFSIYWIFKTLKSCEGNVDKAKEETCRFLEWILETEDDIVRFKKEFIAESEPLIENEVVDEFFFRTLSEEEAQKIRQILA